MDTSKSKKIKKIFLWILIILFIWIIIEYCQLGITFYMSKHSINNLSNININDMQQLYK